MNVDFFDYIGYYTLNINPKGVYYVKVAHQYYPHTTIIYQNAPPPVVYAPPPVVYYQSPRPVTPLYGNTCPIVDGVQTVPILQTNRYGYHERVGCGYQY